MVQIFGQTFLANNDYGDKTLVPVADPNIGIKVSILLLKYKSSDSNEATTDGKVMNIKVNSRVALASAERVFQSDP